MKFLPTSLGCNVVKIHQLSVSQRYYFLEIKMNLSCMAVRFILTFKNRQITFKTAIYIIKKPFIRNGLGKSFRLNGFSCNSNFVVCCLPT